MSGVKTEREGCECVLGEGLVGEWEGGQSTMMENNVQKMSNHINISLRGKMEGMPPLQTRALVIELMGSENKHALLCANTSTSMDVYLVPGFFNNMKDSQEQIDKVINHKPNLCSLLYTTKKYCADILNEYNEITQHQQVDLPSSLLLYWNEMP